jgi:putative heme-binding domain-containing protein
MYRELIEGAMFLPPDVLAQLDPLAGCDRGRIYRIVPEGFKQPAAAPLGSMSTVDLVAQLEHPNGWRRDTASRLMYERQDAAAVEPLRRLLSESTAPLGRLHAMYALDGLDALRESDVLRGLADEQSGVREHAVKLAERFAASSPAIQEELAGLVDDADIRVRYQLAFSAGCLPGKLRDRFLMTLLKRDGGDAWFRVAAQSSLSTGAEVVFGQLLADAAYRDSAAGRQFLAALARQIGRGKHDAEVEAVVQAIDGLPKSEGTDALAKFVLVAAMDQRRGTSSERLINASRGRSAEIVAALLASAGEAALDASAKLDDRIAAVETLGCASFTTARAAIDQLLQPSQPDAMQSAALAALGRFDDPGVAELLLEKWPGLTPQMRAAAAEVLLARPALTVRLLDAVQNKTVAATDLDPARAALLQSHPDEAIRKQAAAVFADAGLGRRADVVAAYQPALEMTGDVERGRKAFRKTCAACHELEDEGTAVGADLHAVRDRGAAAVLLNILDPNREVKPQFLAYVASTVDGLTVSGLIAAETANELTLRRADGSTLQVPRAEIESIQSTGMSFMPEGLEQQIDVQTMADVLAYLNAVN